MATVVSEIESEEDMRVRLKTKKEGEYHYGSAHAFNVHAMAEIIMYFDGDDGGCDSVFTKDVEVEIDGKWISFGEAQRTHAIITDNYNTEFFIPKNDADRERGFTL